MLSKEQRALGAPIRSSTTIPCVRDDNRPGWLLESQENWYGAHVMNTMLVSAMKSDAGTPAPETSPTTRPSRSAPSGIKS